MREAIVAAVAFVAIVYLSAFHGNPTPAEMAVSNPCRQGHAMPNSCLVVSLSKR